MTIYRLIFHEITGVSDKVVEKSRHVAHQIHGFQIHAVYERITKMQQI